MAVEEGVAREVVKISFGACDIVAYGVATFVSKGYGRRLSASLSLAYTFRRGFLKVVFDTLVASNPSIDEIADAAGIVAFAYLISSDGGDGGGPWTGPVKVPPDVYGEAVRVCSSKIREYGLKFGVDMGPLASPLAIALAACLILMVIGMCTSIASKGYPEGVRDFLEYALLPDTQIALSELLA